jgi:expansin (peptidoglycan-binding protein)
VFTAVGEQHDGTYNLGPVAFTGSFPNSCAPYVSDVSKAIGDNLAGLALRFNGDGSLCDTCVTLTHKSKSVIARVITTGETVGPNDIDLSQKAFDALGGDDYPRQMTWALIKCPSAADNKIRYQFQTEANPDWTSLWVRGARMPLKTVEVMSKHHSSWTPLTRQTDGTLNDTAGFGTGKFQLRLTSYDDQVITDSFDSFSAGSLLVSPNQFQ